MQTHDPKYGDPNRARGMAEGNPIVPGLFADPSIAKFGDTYYLYATTDGFGWDTGRWVVWRSNDFVNWSFRGESFPEITGKKNWAPGKPIFRDGKYWLPYTLHGNENRVAVADRPEGPFRDAFPGKPHAPEIDGEIFVDDDGTPYLLYGAHTVKIGALKPDLSGYARGVTTVDFGMGYLEGPFLFKRKGKYYLGVANLGYAEYRIAYGIADHVLGPYRFPKDNLIIQPDPADEIWGTGHGNVVQVGKGDEWALVYLRSRMGERVDPFQGDGNVYRQVCAERLSFNDDGTIRLLKPSRQGVGRLGRSASRGTNLALGAKATASGSLAGYDPEKAVDGGFGTRWLACRAGEPRTEEAWWQVDLGGPKTVRRTEISFNYPTERTPYVLESSLDGVAWSLVADHREDPVYESPKVDRRTVRARYLRVRFPSMIHASIPAGLWEFRAFDRE
jgi:hypothetical protein